MISTNKDEIIKCQQTKLALYQDHINRLTSFIEEIIKNNPTYSKNLFELEKMNKELVDQLNILKGDREFYIVNKKIFSIYNNCIINCFENQKKEKRIDFKNGYYIGIVKNGKANGKGIYYCKDGNKYEGEFKNNKFDGFGINYSKDKAIQVGQWYNNNLNGYGYMKFSDGKEDIGEYKEHKLDGLDITFFPSGIKYCGEHKNGKRNGLCIYIGNNGIKEVGFYKDDKASGEFIRFNKDGSRQKIVYT